MRVKDGLADLWQHEARPTNVLVRYDLAETRIVRQPLLLGAWAKLAPSALLLVLLGRERLLHPIAHIDVLDQAPIVPVWSLAAAGRR